MSTSIAGAAPQMSASHIENLKVAIIRTAWNIHITEALTRGALERFHDAGYPPESVEVMEVPGAVELTYAARRVMSTGKYQAVIVIGCVIRGDTPHFDYVCQSVTHGMTELNLRGEVPVIFGVLTVDNEQAALDRAGGRLGNKGSEFADAALVMIDRFTL